MKEHGLQEPEFENNRNYFKVTFKNDYNVDDVSGQQINITDVQKRVISYCKEPKSISEIKEYLDIRSRQYISSKIIKPLLEVGLIENTNKESIYKNTKVNNK